MILSGSAVQTNGFGSWLANSDAEQAVASRLGIQGIPTMIPSHEGREIARTSGAMSATEIVRWVRDRMPMVAA